MARQLGDLSNTKKEWRPGDCTYEFPDKICTARCDVRARLETGAYATGFACAQKVCTRKVFLRGGVREKRAGCERSCVSFARLFTWRRIRRGRSRKWKGERWTNRQKHGFSFGERVPAIVPSNALFKMSLAHVCQTNDLVGKSALARKETDITSQTIARRPFSLSSSFFSSVSFV